MWQPFPKSDFASSWMDLACLILFNNNPAYFLRNCRDLPTSLLAASLTTALDRQQGAGPLVQRQIERQRAGPQSRRVNTAICETDTGKRRPWSLNNSPVAKQLK